MKCPLRKLYVDVTLGHKIGEFQECIKEECAWWDPSLNICSVRTIGGKLDDIDTVLGQIMDKMPHEEQFRK